MKKLITATALSLALLAGGSTSVATATTAEAATPTKTRITLVVAGKSTKTETTAKTVGGLLTGRKIAHDADDQVSPSLATAITADMTVRVDRISVSTITVTEKLAYKKVTTRTTKLHIRESKTIKGKSGSVKRTYTVTTKNGKTVKKVLVTAKILKAARDSQKLIGINNRSHGHKLNDAHWSRWMKIARCESGQRWHLNGAYDGGLQFSPGTWRAYGGRDFAKYAYKASRIEQVTIANRVHKHQGFRPWGCA